MYKFYVYNRTLRAWLTVSSPIDAWTDYEGATAFKTEAEAQAALAKHGGRFICEVMRVEAT